MKKKLIRITTIPISLKTLLKGQLKYMSQYYEILAISSDGDCFETMTQEQEIRGVRINMTRKISPLSDFVALIRLIFLFIRERPFIVHTHTPKAGTLGQIAAWIARVPHRLHTVAGLPLLETKGCKRLLLTFVEKITYGCATRIFPNSFGLKEIILLNKYAPKRKLEVLCNGSSNGIDTFFFSMNQIGDQGNQIKTRLNIRPSDFTFCFVGRMVKDKGINELVRAFVSLNKKYPDTRLLLVGPFEKELDPLSHEVENIIFTHEKISYMGYQEDVRPYFAASNALVFPSYREGFPNVVMQAGAMGLPSIVTDINGCNEIIIEGKNGIIIPPKNEIALCNAMNYFIEHKDDKVKEMAANARPLIESRYEQKMVWEAILAMYKNLEQKK
jgi:glycosyltransferase involved in cell wall biosynthesis